MKYINGEAFVYMLTSASNKLENAKESINKLNVFPVPDGDTGTNMSLTFSKAVSEVMSLTDTTVKEASKVLASASLRGARGNSGVILSQFLRGISKGLAEADEASIENFALAIEAGKDSAYNAVMKPTEGTILTVMRALSDKAMEIKDDDYDFVEFFDLIIKYGKEILDKTPDMLPKLKQAGVVDAGGKGLIIIFEGMYDYLSTGDIVLPDDPSKKVEASIETNEEIILSDEEIVFGYCTEFLIIKNQSGAEILRNKLAKIGDCVVAVEDDEIIKVHVHTNQPDKAIGYGLEYGSLINLKVDNMRYQRDQLKKKQQVSKEPVEKSKYAFISVTSGEGFRNIFSELGINGFVSGGQSMNPSTEDILKTAEELNADNIFVFPNNKNIILAAQQAAEIYQGNMIVVPTTSLAQVFPIMLLFEESKEPEELNEEFCEALNNIQTGQVTYAVRDSVVNDINISEGDIMALNNDKVTAVSDSPENAVMLLLEQMDAENSEMITVYYGSDINSNSSEKLIEEIQNKYPNAEVSLLEGGQPVYYYIISVE